MKFLIAIFCVCLSIPALADALTSFRGDERHQGLYPGPGVPVLHGLKWKFATKGPVMSSPVIDSSGIYFGSSDGNVYAVS